MSSRPAPAWLLALLACLPMFVTADPGREFVRLVEAELLQPVIDETPGAAAVLVLDGKVVLQKTWGVRQVGSPEPVTPFTVFRLASVSKTFASAAAAILVAETPVSWDSPVLEKVDHVRFKRGDYGRQITLGHLMSQSTGLMPHAYTNLVEDNMSYENILQRLHKVDFVCPPGKCYGYQNVVFSLVGDVVAAETGVPYDQFVSQKLFAPLKMQRASIGREAFISEPDHAKPHVWRSGDWRTTRTTPHYYRIPPAAGVNASIDDMRVWLLAQLGQRPEVLPAPLLDTMHEPVINTTRQQAHYRYRRGLRNVAYGLGWRVFDYGEQTGFVHHGGYVKGMRSEMVFNRDLQLGLVFLTNSEPRDLGELVFDLIDLYELHGQADKTGTGNLVAR